jgi:hypothetical protein
LNAASLEKRQARQRLAKCTISLHIDPTEQKEKQATKVDEEKDCSKHDTRQNHASSLILQLS